MTSAQQREQSNAGITIALSRVAVSAASKLASRLALWLFGIDDHYDRCGSQQDTPYTSCIGANHATYYTPVFGSTLQPREGPGQVIDPARNMMEVQILWICSRVDRRDLCDHINCVCLPCRGVLHSASAVRHGPHVDAHQNSPSIPIWCHQG